MARLDDDQLSWGALVAQAISRRLEFKPPRFNAVPIAMQGPETADLAKLTAPLPGDAILVGTRDQLRAILGEDWVGEISAAYLAILPHPQDKTRLILVVSGRDTAEVKQAATALAFLAPPFPEEQAVLVHDLQLPELPQGTAPSFLPGRSRARFADLGVGTTTLVSPLAPARWFNEPGFAGPGNEVSEAQRSLRIRFWLQPGLYVKGFGDAILRLNFSYGTGFRRDSVLNVLINGLFVRAIPLTEPLGATLLDYKLHIPAGMLRSGYNQLELLPMLVPTETGWCQLRQAENLLLTIYGDSTLQLPPLSQFAKLPDLELYARTGFPLLNDPQGGQLAIQVVGGTPESASAAWTILARLAQITGIPLYRAQISRHLPPADRELLVVGALADLDPAIKTATSLFSNGAQSGLLVRSLRTIAEAEGSRVWWERLLASLQGWFEPPIAEPQDHQARIVYARRTLGAQGLLTACESPFHSARTLVVVSAEQAPQLAERAAQLVQPEYWFNLRGALVLWDDQPANLRWQAPNRVYLVGNGPLDARLSFMFSQYPQALLVILVVLAIGLAGLLTILIQGFKRRHHPLIPDED